MKSELEIFLYTKDETIAKLSKELGINDKTLSNKLKGKREFKANEIRIVSEKFHLWISPICLEHVVPKVSKIC